MLVPALIIVGENRYAARVLNLSTTGALLGTTAQLEAGVPVTFACGTIQTAATVIRQDSGVLGIKFLAELAQNEVRYQADRTAAVQEYLQRHRERPGQNAATAGDVEPRS